MPYVNRRNAVKLLGSVVLGSASLTGSASAERGGKPPKGGLQKMGHSLLSDPPGGYAEGVIRDDGAYGLLGSYLGEGGSFLVDLSNPRAPTEAHRVPSSAAIRNADVAFDPRDGLYYRTQEPNEDVSFAGVEIIDYGFDEGTVEDPVILGEVPAGSTHNVFAHPDAPVLYTTEENGMGVWDVSDPSDPTELGRFDYEGRPNYEEISVAGFESCHYADYDPERDIVVVGDEIGLGIPGGKHVFDIGWEDGSPSDPRHVGFFHSPNAEPMDQPIEFLDWTTHNHDIIPKGETTLMVDGGYREGAWVADISDPRNPVSTAKYATVDKLDEANGMLIPENPPVAWSADYSKERDLTLVADQETGVYTFKVTPEKSEDISTH